MTDTIFVLVSAACYSQRIAPVADQFARSGDVAPVIKLVKEAQQRMAGVPDDENPFLIILPDHRYDELQGHLDILEGREFYGPSRNHVPPRPGARTSKADMKDYVEREVYASLFWGLCVEYRQGFPPKHVLTRGRLLRYLYERSPYLEEAFTGSLHGVTLQRLSYIELLSTDDVRKISEELGRVPPPDDAVEHKRQEEKLEALKRSGRSVFVSVEFADVVGPASTFKQFDDLKRLLQHVLTHPGLAVAQVFQ